MPFFAGNMHDIFAIIMYRNPIHKRCLFPLHSGIHIPRKIKKKIYLFPRGEFPPGFPDYLFLFLIGDRVYTLFAAGLCIENIPELW